MNAELHIARIRWRGRTRVRAHATGMAAELGEEVGFLNVARHYEVVHTLT